MRGVAIHQRINRPVGTRALWAIGMSLLTASCHVSWAIPVAATELPSVAPDGAFVDRSLLISEPCAPPCWMGIQPGLTTPKEAETLISSLPYVSREAPVSEESYWIDGSAATVVAHQCTFRPRAPCVTYDVVKGVVVQVRVRAAFNMSFGDVVDALGPPDYYLVERLPFQSYCGVGLTWTDRGVTIGSGQKDLASCDRVRDHGVSSAEIVEGVIYTAQSEMPKQIEVGRDMPWTGFATP